MGLKKIYISWKHHFLVDFLSIWDHFKIVMWQTYIYNVVSEKDFCWQKCYFWRNFFSSFQLFQVILTSYGRPTRDFCTPKIYFWDDFLKLFLPHYYYKVVSDLQKNPSGSVFFQDIFCFNPFSKKLPRIKFKTYQHRK